MSDVVSLLAWSRCGWRLPGEEEEEDEGGRAESAAGRPVGDPTEVGGCERNRMFSHCECVRLERAPMGEAMDRMGSKADSWRLLKKVFSLPLCSCKTHPISSTSSSNVPGT